MKRRPRWVPVTLRWRRPRRPLPVTRTRWAAPLALHATWLAHFHLHFGAPSHERIRRSETLHFFVMASSHRRERIASNRSSTVNETIARSLLRETTRVERMHRTRGGRVVIHHAMRNAAPSLSLSLSPLTLHAAWLAHRHLHFGVRSFFITTAASHRTERFASSRYSHSTVIRAAILAMRMHRAYEGRVVVQHSTRNVASRTAVMSAVHAQLSTLLRNDVRTSTMRRESAHSADRTHSRELQAFRLFASSSRVRLVHRRVEERTATRLQVARPAELVWRRQPAPVGESEGSPRAERAVSLSRSVPLESIAASPASPAAALQAARIDLDRLTDDVIRRVERRARIERERRGL